MQDIILDNILVLNLWFELKEKINFKKIKWWWSYNEISPLSVYHLFLNSYICVLFIF